MNIKRLKPVYLTIYLPLFVAAWVCSLPSLCSAADAYTFIDQVGEYRAKFVEFTILGTTAKSCPLENVSDFRLDEWKRIPESEIFGFCMENGNGTDWIEDYIRFFRSSFLPIFREPHPEILTVGRVFQDVFTSCDCPPLT